MNRLTLRFPSELEQPFLEDYFSSSLKALRVGYLVGVGLEASELVSYLTQPGARLDSVEGAVHLGLIGVWLVAGSLAFTSLFKRWLGFINGSALVLIGVAFTVLVSSRTAAHTYEATLTGGYFGILLAMTVAFTLSRIGFVNANIVSWLVMAQWIAGVARLGIPNIASHIQLLLIGYTVAAMAGYIAELYTRKHFVERDKAERLLLNVLPATIAERLKNHPGTIADRFEEVSVVFADVVGFTSLSASMPAEDVVALLNAIFSEFDLLAQRHGLEKIKTIGDAYMVVAGLPVPRPDHAQAAAEMALDMVDAISRLNGERGWNLHIRVGLHAGPAVAGVIGRQKFIYDLWGDSVNTASRMESQGLPDAIQVSQAMYERLCGQYRFKRRGPIEVKGKGEMVTYLLAGRSTSPMASTAVPQIAGS
ncbi:MAG: adenylate/guanylate cyclase domain-containing protein [Chloroflexota bacterium]|nr:adenylate/guanylate cyclase domain-containing protein [Chloroflexota bacterium]